MAVQKILLAPHPSLRTVAKPIEVVDKKMNEYLRNLGDTLQAATKPRGVGLAAPQIDRSWRAFCTWLDTSTADEPVFRLFINPKITDVADKLSIGPNPRDPDLEGRLSIPHLYGPVLRPEWVTFSFQSLLPDNTLSDWHSETFFDFSGRVMQHELDHLNGVLFTDHILSQGQQLFQVVGDKLHEVEVEIAKAYL